MRFTCPAHLIFPDLVALMKLRSSSLQKIASKKNVSRTLINRVEIMEDKYVPQALEDKTKENEIQEDV
jgi:transcriptional regulator with XRE-family HTH domain